MTAGSGWTGVSWENGESGTSLGSPGSGSTFEARDTQRALDLETTDGALIEFIGQSDGADMRDGEQGLHV